MGHGCKAKGGYYIYLCNLTMLKIVPEKEKKKKVNGCATYKRTDVWSRDFIIWKINSGLWAEVWAGLWKKGVEPIMCNFRGLFFHFFGVKKMLDFFLPMKNSKKHPKKLLIIGPNPFIPLASPGHSPQPKIDFPYYEISGPNICSLIINLSQVFYKSTSQCTSAIGQKISGIN